MQNTIYGRIYKIEPINAEEGDIYIGSTTRTLNIRMNNHKSNYKQYINGKYAYTRSHQLFDKYTINNCFITLLEDAYNKEDLLIRECFYISTLKCVNKCMPISNIIQNENKYCDKNKSCHFRKQYYQDNKDKIKLQYKIKKEQKLLTI